MQPITDYNAFFEGAKTALANASELTKTCKELRSAQQEYDNSLTREKRALNDSISSAISKKRREIERMYDSQISTANDELRKANSKREKARNQGVRDRIAEETADMRSHIDRVRAQIRTEIRSANLPEFCRSDLFYTLFYPRNFGQVLIVILVFIMCFFIIPYGIYGLFFRDKPVWVLILIYVIDIALFGGLYVLLSKKTVYANDAVLKRCRNYKAEIEQTKRQITEKTRQIELDKDDQKYNLASYDDEIAHIKQELADLTFKKKDALDTFENVTKGLIADDLTEKATPLISEISKRAADTAVKLQQTDAQRSAVIADIRENYEPYLGHEFMDMAKINVLEDIMKSGNADSIPAAIEEYNKRKG